MYFVARFALGDVTIKAVNRDAAYAKARAIERKGNLGLFMIMR